MPSIRYLLTNTTHEIPNFIRYLAVPIILFSLTNAEAEKMFSHLKIVKTKLFNQMSQDFFNRLSKCVFIVFVNIYFCWDIDFFLVSSFFIEKTLHQIFWKGYYLSGCLFCRESLIRSGRTSSDTFSSTGKVVHRLSKSVVGWNIHIPLWKLKNSLWIVNGAKRSQ